MGWDELTRGGSGGWRVTVVVTGLVRDDLSVDNGGDRLIWEERSNLRSLSLAEADGMKEKWN